MIVSDLVNTKSTEWGFWCGAPSSCPGGGLTLNKRRLRKLLRGERKGTPLCFAHALRRRGEGGLLEGAARKANPNRIIAEQGDHRGGKIKGIL